MRIGVSDPSGGGLGLAVGLAELGHRVTYEGPAPWYAADAPESAQLAAVLAQHTFGAHCATVDPAACDVVVIVDVFADFLAPLALYAAAGRGRLSAPPGWLLLYPARLARAIQLGTSSDRVVIVDNSDCDAPRETAFETLPHATLLAREVCRADRGPWRPLPFLFNNVLLWLERVQPRAKWWIPPAERRRRVDWSFCGTVDHARYGGGRRRALDEIAESWPLVGEVHERLAFVEVLQQLQASRVGLDLAGAGQLCFRLHECLALGVPVWRPEPFGIEIAPGLDAVVGREPEPLFGIDPEEVRAVYEECYSPRAAAHSVLASAGFSPTKTIRSPGANSECSNGTM